MENLKCWARLKTPVNVPLRLGGWYRVTSHTLLEAVVLVEGRGAIKAPRAWLDIRTDHPAEWTVVRKRFVGPRTPVACRNGYIVCPDCHERVALPPLRRKKHVCPRCGGDFAIAWDEGYLDGVLA
ncbi:MAG TPA: hypothetical protein VLV45_15310 [Gemmatimonadales bacterium]|nr:hypothetical protein [Gemmatimonadales bacterium]